jgi:predicted Zn-dependent protease
VPGRAPLKIGPMLERAKRPCRAAARVLALAALLAPAGDARGAQGGLFDFLFSDLNLVSKQQEAQIAQSFARDVESKSPMVRDPEVQDYVAGLGGRLVRSLRSPDFRYRFRVVDDPQVNAFGIGGGFIYLNAGTIAASDTEGEVAAVLAHEIGHQVKRHVAKQISRQTVFENLARAAIGSRASQWVELGASLGITTGQLYFGREAEREADSVMVQLLPASGYDPREALAMFAKLRAIQGSDPGLVATVLSSHPPTSERSENVRAEISRVRARSGLARDSSRFHDVRRRVLAEMPRRR